MTPQPRVPADPASSSGPATITVVHAPDCHLCHDAEAAVADLGSRYPLRVEQVDLNSPRGQALTAQHRPALNPLVLVDGRFFSQGRLPRGKLRRLLDARLSGPARVS